MRKILSVAVPCYNSEAYMHRCIDSLLPGGDEVEIIIVDDGSGDKTAEIADRLSGGASPCQGEGRGFDPRLALLVCPKVVRYLVYRKVVHCVTDHIFVQREVRSTSRTHAKQGFGSPPPKVGLGRFGGKKVHRTLRG